MKLRLHLSALAAIAVPAAALCQIQGSAPEYMGTFEAVVNGSYVPLERGTATMQSRGKLMGGAETYYSFSSGRSPVRLAASQRPYFVVKAETYDMDPASALFLYALVSKGKERRLVVASSGIYGGPTVDPLASKYRVSVNYQKAGPGLMKVIPSGTLAPGEYMLTTANPMQGFLFGVD
ncbi:MAG: hypothetical protein JWO81_2635 [Alphaproteobacteria bacterium]|nr:hypothetical protein [Alphaproteobacteria bacterium]